MERLFPAVRRRHDELERHDLALQKPHGAHRRHRALVGGKHSSGDAMPMRPSPSRVSWQSRPGCLRRAAKMRRAHLGLHLRWQPAQCDAHLPAERRRVEGAAVAVGGSRGWPALRWHPSAARRLRPALPRSCVRSDRAACATPPRPVPPAAPRRSRPRRRARRPPAGAGASVPRRNNTASSASEIDTARRPAAASIFSTDSSRLAGSAASVARLVPSGNVYAEKPSRSSLKGHRKLPFGADFQIPAQILRADRRQVGRRGQRPGRGHPHGAAFFPAAPRLPAPPPAPRPERSGLR